MPNFSQITILGHAGRDAELRTTQSGKSVASFSVAVKDSHSGETTWFNVATFGNTAEKYVGPYLKKGNIVHVVGTPKLNTYEGKDGQTKANIEIIARSVEICERREDSAQSAPVSNAVFEDAIPF